MHPIVEVVRLVVEATAGYYEGGLGYVVSQGALPLSFWWIEVRLLSRFVRLVRLRVLPQFQ